MTTTGRAGMGGHAPKVTISGPAKKMPTEQEKYERAWSDPRYRTTAPGAHYVKAFFEHAKPWEGDTLIDFGAGSGAAAFMLHKMAKLNVTAMDFAANALNEDIRERLAPDADPYFKFVQHDLSVWPYPTSLAQYGFCTDVMEHVPPEQVPGVLKNILRAARRVFFSIATEPDKASEWMGLDYPLHLTVRDAAWWKTQFESLQCTVFWEHTGAHAAYFYVTAFANANDFRERLSLNVEEQQVKDNIVANLSGGYHEVSPHERQDTEIGILAGGPSLNDHADEIFQHAKNGMPMITVNGTYKWALDHNILPAAQVVIDGREFNHRFVDPIIPNCKYMIASQVTPKLLQKVPKDQVWLWHSGASAIVREAIDDWCAENNARRSWWPVYGGSTVVLRTIPLLTMLGFHKLHMWGFDSCLRGDDHHAYPQEENDRIKVIDLLVAGRSFKVQPWMMVQANEFMDLVRALGELCELEVYGDGLIAHILRTAAERPVDPEAKPKKFFISTKET